MVPTVNAMDTRTTHPKILACPPPRTSAFLAKDRSKTKDHGSFPVVVGKVEKYMVAAVACWGYVPISQRFAEISAIAQFFGMRG
jgi:hypothetical protein